LSLEFVAVVACGRRMEPDEAIRAQELIDERKTTQHCKLSLTFRRTTTCSTKEVLIKKPPWSACFMVFKVVFNGIFGSNFNKAAQKTETCLMGI
jgi:hypothetical protein